MTQKEEKQHVVLCEGFDDRSFWAGWLQHLGCTDPTNRGRVKVKDAWGRPVIGGRYLLLTPSGSKIIVHPFQGRAQVRKAANEYLRGQVYRPESLILNLDSDAEASAEDTAQQAIQSIVEHFGGEAASQGQSTFLVDGVRVFAVIWKADDPDSTTGVPSKQTLERLVAASIQAAYPDRGPVVDNWLQAEPRAEIIDHKNYGYSYLAKWYADHGADDFFRAVWRDKAVAVRLRERLESTGAWESVASLVTD